MVDVKLLSKKIEESGLKREYIADQCGMTRTSFYNKVNNRSDFTTREVSRLCELLSITKLTEKETIFFAKEVN